MLLYIQSVGQSQKKKNTGHTGLKMVPFEV